MLEEMIDPEKVKEHRKAWLKAERALAIGEYWAANFLDEDWQIQEPAWDSDVPLGGGDNVNSCCC